MAVDFNPQIQELGNRDWSGSSRGTGPNRSFEALFGGLAETANNLVSNRDAQTRDQIEEDSREMFESVNTEFGFDPPPAGMQGELDRIVALQNAMEQGKISSVNYYGRLATLSKQLRSKYPRYESIVDSTIQSVTGTRPANAYRDALMSELDSINSSATDQAKERRSWERQNEGVITAIFGEEYWQDPSRYDITQVQSKVGAWKGETETIDAELKRLQRNAENGEVNTEQANRQADRTFSFTVRSALDRVGQGQGFDQMVSTFISSGGEGLDEFMVEMTSIEHQIRAELTAMGERDFVQSGLLSREDLNKRVEEAMAPINQIRDSLLGGDFEFASRMVKVNNDIAERGLQEIYRRVPAAKIGAGLSKMNPYAGAEWMTLPQGEEGSVLTQIQNAATEMTGHAAAGDTGKVIIKEVLDSGDQRVSRQTIETFFNVIRDPNAPQNHVSNLVNELFGPEVDFMSSDVVSSSDLEQIYTRFLDPSVTQAILEKGTPEDFQKYSMWAVEKFRALPNVRAAAGNVNSALGNLNPEDVDISYDPSSNRLVLKVLNESALIQPGRFKMSTPLLRPFVGSFNRALAVLDPIAKANGQGMEQLVPDLLREMNRLEEGGRSDGFFKMLYDKVLGSAEGEGEGQEGGREILGSVEEDTDLDFIVNQSLAEGGRRTTPSSYEDEATRNVLDMIGQAEHAGYDTLFGYSESRYGVKPTAMTISEVQDLQRRMGRELGSSAAGKYQIMQDTLKDAIREMGLTGNEMFDEEMQDRIATEFLLPRRGYDKFRRGEISSNEFIRNMSQEWASIPSSIGGQSFYAGDRMGNKASGGGQALARMLAR